MSLILGGIQEDFQMSNYPIFHNTGKQRVAINPDAVARIHEIEPQKLIFYFFDGQSINVNLALENAVARLLGNQELAPEHR